LGSVLLAAVLAYGLLSRYTQHMLSLAAGALLATSFMHLLPEAFESGTPPQQLFLTLLLCVVFFFLLDKAELWHQCIDESGKPKKNPRVFWEYVNEQKKNKRALKEQEKAAKAQGHEVRVGKFPFIGNGKAIALGEPEGLVKTVFDARTGELLGAHMIGAEVTELIQGYGIARTLETTEAELMHTVFPHPTLSEMMHEAVLAAYGKTLHM